MLRAAGEGVVVPLLERASAKKGSANSRTSFC